MPGRLEGFQALTVQQLSANADLLYRHTLTFTDGTTVRCSVQDPNKTSQGAQLATRLAQSVEDLEALDLRLLKYHPADQPPNRGASVAWQGGTLTVIDYSQVSDFSGTATGVCRWSGAP